MRRYIQPILMASFLILLTLSAQAQDAAARVQGDPADTRDVTGTGRPITSVREGGLETAGIWTEKSKRFTYIICNNPVTCTSNSLIGPRSGTGWVWFGGTPEKEKASISQPLYIPNTSGVFLQFYYRVSSYNAGGNPKLQVRIDGTVVWNAGITATTAGYQFVTVDLSAYADANLHTLEFFYKASATSSSNSVTVDDISLYKGDSLGVTNPGFESGDSGWFLTSGSGEMAICGAGGKPYTGDCSYRFKGSAGENSTLEQVFLRRSAALPVPEVRAPPYYRVYLGAFVKAPPTALGNLSFIIGFTDGSRIKGKVSLAGTGAYTWLQTPPVRYASDKSMDSASITILHKSQSNTVKVWVDDIEFYYAADYS